MKARLIFLPLVGIAIAGGPAYATVYLSVEQARNILFPGATFQAQPRTLTEDQVKAIEHACGVHVLSKQLKVWRVSTGGWFIVDEVVGKHEYIPFALGLDDKGARAAELVAVITGPRRIKVVPCIEGGVAQEFEGAAVQVVRSRFRGNYNLTAAIVAIFGVEVVGQHLELIDRIEVGNDGRTRSARSSARQSSSAIVAGNASRVDGRVI